MDKNKSLSGIICCILCAALILSTFLSGCKKNNKPKSNSSNQYSSVKSETSSENSENHESVPESSDSSAVEKENDTSSVISDGKSDSASHETVSDSKEPAPPEKSEEPEDGAFSSVRRSCGSFIQTWMCQNWSLSRWETELKNMKKSGMDFIILQSVADMTYDTDSIGLEDLSNPSGIPSVIPLKSSSCTYPSNMPEFPDKPQVDMLENCFKACKNTGMKVMIGTISDNRYWKFGWESGAPLCPSGKSDPVNESYAALWVNEYAERSDRMIKEIMSRYGSRYKDQIYGWYYNPEVWNIKTACKGRDGKAYAKIIGRSLTLFAESCTKYCSGKPMLLSPFINPMLSSASQCGNMWKDIFEYTHFRKGDIFCPQDSFGNNTFLNLEDWYREYKRAADTKSGLRFWANNENFRKNGACATLDSYLGQVKATAKYTENNICFSWNHYYSPELKNSGYDKAYRYYIHNGKYDTSAPAVSKVDVNGKVANIISSDNIGVHSIKIYKSDKKTVVKENICFDTDNINSLQRFKLEKGTYYAQAFDFYSNGSSIIKFTVS